MKEARHGNWPIDISCQRLRKVTSMARKKLRLRVSRRITWRLLRELYEHHGAICTSGYEASKTRRAISATTYMPLITAYRYTKNVLTYRIIQIR